LVNPGTQAAAVAETRCGDGDICFWKNADANGNPVDPFSKQTNALAFNPHGVDMVPHPNGGMSAQPIKRARPWADVP
jgi:hypothetical protein